MTQPSAKIIADSISPDGVRLTTMEVAMHRFVLAEFNTHRVFSRNSASSRAIPYDKIRSKVLNDVAFPVEWASEQRGMQGGIALGSTDKLICAQEWEGASRDALTSANACKDAGLHKSLINRLLEPFMWHTVIVTATEWDNFFWQRCHSDAQPEMKAAADAMQLAYYTHRPTELNYSQWHLPFVDLYNQKSEDYKMIDDYLGGQDDSHLGFAKSISVARCARVSYLNHDGTRLIEKDLELYERLTQGQHWSPFEHVATPIPPSFGLSEQDSWSGNFRGWRQFRKDFQNEHRGNFIPNHPLLINR